VTVALVTAALRQRAGPRRIIPLAVVAAAGLAILNVAALPWIGLPLLLYVVAVARDARRSGERAAWLEIGLLAGIGLLAAAPTLASAGHFVTVAQDVLVKGGTDLGNLSHPIPKWEVLGIWPEADYRFDISEHSRLAHALMGVAAAAALVGAWWAVRRRQLGPLVLIATAAVAAAVLLSSGTPYADAKTLMIASPAVAVAAVLGAAALLESGRRVEAVALAAVLTAGIGWANVDAYRGSQAAPRPRYEEERTIASRFSGQGPALVNEWDEFAPHFLREMRPYVEPNSIHETRPVSYPTRGERATYPVDPDRFTMGYIERFPLLVIRRSPLMSRPPSNFTLAWQGRYYEVWRRDPTQGSILVHLPLGGDLRPAARPSCQAVRHLAASAGRSRARIAYVERPGLVRLDPGRISDRPRSWVAVETDPATLKNFRPGSGVVRGTVVTPGGPSRVWLMGEFGARFSVEIDGRRIGSAERQLAAFGQVSPIAPITLSRGRHEIRIVREPSSLAPGEWHVTQERLGPLILQPQPDQRMVHYASSRKAAALCGKNLDWIEIVR
jgi:hypothetical protein